MSERKKSRRSSVRLLLILKHNIENEGDLQLAELEVEGLLGSAGSPVADVLSRARQLVSQEAFDTLALSQHRFYAGGCQGYELELGDDADIEHLVRRLTYFREFLAIGPVDVPKNPCVQAFGSGEGIVVRATPLYNFLEMSGWFVRKNKTVAQVEVELDRAVETLLRGNGKGDQVLNEALAANRKKNEYLTHAFHKYKAKFFPRMARSLTNYVSPGQGSVCDPFAGSGTLLVEAGALGVRSIGIDIDPLCVLISDVKACPPSLDPKQLERIAESARAAGRPVVVHPAQQTLDKTPAPTHRDLRARLPEFIGKKLDAASRNALENETQALLEQIDNVEKSDGTEAARYCRVALSHALATKYNMRWVGTGEPRFALELNSFSITTLYSNHLSLMGRFIATIRLLERRGLLAETPAPVVKKGDARKLPLRDQEVAGIVTSPPYLPASSGRETYARSRGPSLVALGLMTEEEILRVDREVVGTMAPAVTDRPFPLPKEVQQLVHFLKTEEDRQGRTRAHKVLPTERYFYDMVDALREMKRVLVPGGKAAVVVGKVHKFYKLTTKETLFAIDASRVLVELATNPAYGVGLEVDRVIDLKLTKQDYAARPKSTDDYFEAILVFRRPK